MGAGGARRTPFAFTNLPEPDVSTRVAASRIPIEKIGGMYQWEEEGRVGPRDDFPK